MALTAPTTSGYSAFWSTTGDRLPYSMSQSQGRYKSSKHIARFLRITGGRDVQAALAALIGAAPGGVAANSWTQVPMPAGPQAATPVVTGITDFAGVRTAVTKTAINRATTAADVTELKKWFNNALLTTGILYPNPANARGSTVAFGMMHANVPGFL
jgi:hypothetical protein